MNTHPKESALWQLLKQARSINRKDTAPLGLARWIRRGSGQFPPPGGALRMRKGQRMNLILNRRAKPDAKAVSIVMADMLAAHSMQKLAARAIKISNPADARY